MRSEYAFLPTEELSLFWWNVHGVYFATFLFIERQKHHANVTVLRILLGRDREATKTSPFNFDGLLDVPDTILRDLAVVSTTDIINAASLQSICRDAASQLAPLDEAVANEKQTTATKLLLSHREMESITTEMASLQQ